MTDLSPAAQKVLDAYFTHADLLNREVSHEEMISAAIRALADEVIPITKTPWGSTFVPVFSAMASRERILAIATELEGKMTTTPDFRKSCAELVEQLDEMTCNYDVPNQSALIERVLNELATPPPEPPTDQEIQEWADAKLGVDQGDPEAFGWGWRCFKGEAFAVTIRAALERWGHR